MKIRTAASTPRSAGITLTEILISILILGVGLVSLATLFPIGLLRLRDAQRLTRSAYLVQSATADVAARGLLSSNSFIAADLLNSVYGFNLWYAAGNPLGGNPLGSNLYNPLVWDTPYYGADPYDIANGGANQGVSAQSSGGNGLPFAYDPLWRYWTSPAPSTPPNPPIGTYLNDNNPAWAGYPGGIAPEARFGAGSFALSSTTSVSLLRLDSDGFVASAHGLQRLTNFNRVSYINAANQTVWVMPSAAGIPSTFVSPEDVVWQESSNPNYNVAFLGGAVGTPSTVVPDLSLSTDSKGFPTSTNDWRFSWILTAQQNSSANGAAFEGNIVVFENRPFSLDPITVGGTTFYQPAGETVVEAVYGPSKNISPPPPSTQGYGVGADRTVLLRWYATLPDPVVKVGDFIADVTYERSQNLVNTRFVPVPNQYTLEWDNLPAQRCFWYQVQKVTPAQPDPALGPTFRSMTVYVNRPLDAKTLLGGTGSSVGLGNPVVMNAALICPYIVNVIPQTFFVR